MTHELLKQLKEAGFPLKYAQSPHEIVNGCQFDDGSIGYFPDLSELIEACGKPFVLHSPNSTEVGEMYWWNRSDDWIAFYQAPNPQIEAKGKTPEEAVAKLWLALNKKNV